MAFPYDTDDQAAIARLAALEQSDFTNGGHITAFVPTLNDVADVANAVADAAAAADADATTATTQATAAAASAAKLSGTSATSVEIGLGSKAFTTQASKFFAAGTALRIVSDANPDTHFMAGVVTAYSGTSLTVDVEVFGGSGERADWTIMVSGQVGQAGTLEFGAVTALAPGAAPTVSNAGTPSAADVELGIPVGKPAGLAFAWSTATTNDDPGSGKLKLNSTSLSAATKIYISETDADGRAVASIIATWDDSTSDVKAQLRIFDPVTPENYAVFAVTGATTDNGGWDTLTVEHVDHGGTLTNDLRIYVEADPTGDKGDEGDPGAAATIEIGTILTGAPGSSAVLVNNGTPNAALIEGSLPRGATGERGAVVGVRYTFSSTTTDSDPGPGTLRFNSATISSATQAFFDNTEADGADVTGWLDSFDASTATIKGYLGYVVETDPTIRGLFRVTGSVVDGTGYRKVTIANEYALGTPANGAALSLSFVNSGNNGLNGEGTGTVIGPESTTVNHVPQWDSTDGTTLKNGVALTAANVAFTPTGSIAASTTQDAIAELETEKQPIDATLTALAALDGTAGLLEQTGGDTFVRRAIGVGASTSVLTRADGDGRFLKLDGGTLTGALTLSGDASSSLHPVTKQQFDAALLTMGRRQRVRVATTANITIATALNNGDTLDGITLATNDLVLVKNQSAPAENGIYVVGASPARWSEFDTYDEHAGSLIAVEEGTAGADTLWLCTSNRGGTLNSTAISFTQLFFSAYTAGTGLQLVGQQFSISDAELLAIAGVTSAADKGIHFTGSGTAATHDQTAAARTFMAHADAAAQFNGIKQAASTTATGVVELATVAEAGTGTDTSRAVTPAGLFPAAVDVASATTTDIGAAASSVVRITGTTTITGFGTGAAGIRRTGYFAGALTLTHNGTSLILPGGANITTAANDRFEAYSLGSGNWLVLDYTKADGTAVGSSGGAAWTAIGSPAVVSSAVASVTFTSIPSSYTDLRLKVSGLSHDNATSRAFKLRFSNNNGSSYSTVQLDVSPTVASSALVDSVAYVFGYNENVIIAVGGGTDQASIAGDVADTRYFRVTGGIDALQILATVGNIDAGTLTLEGR